MGRGALLWDEVERGNFISFVDGVNKPLRVCPQYTEELVQHKYAMRCAEEHVDWIRPLLENQACFKDRALFAEFNWAC